MLDPRTDHVMQVSKRVARQDYAIDPEAVAAAILERLLEGRTLHPPGRDR